MTAPFIDSVPGAPPPPREEGEYNLQDMIDNMTDEERADMRRRLFKASPAGTIMRRLSPTARALKARSKSWIYDNPIDRMGTKLLEWGQRKVGMYANEVARGATRGALELANTAGDAAVAASEFYAATRGVQMLPKRVAATMRDGLETERILESVYGSDVGHSGVSKFAGGIAQFAVGWMLTGPAGKIGSGLKGLSGIAARQGVNMARGAVSDVTVQDPNSDRLVNMLFQDAPGDIGEAARWLEKNPDDPEAVGRLKNALDGLVTGVAFDAAVAAVRRSGGAAIEALAKRWTPKEGEAPKLADFGAPKDGEEPIPTGADEAFEAVETPSGEVRIVPKQAAAEGVEIPDEALVTVESIEEAAPLVASLNYKARNESRPPTVTEEQAGFMRTLARWIHDTGKADDVMSGKIDPETGTLKPGWKDTNFRYDLASGQLKALLSSASTIMRNEFDAARLTRGVSHEESLDAANRLLAGRDADELLSSDTVAGVMDAQGHARWIMLAARMVRLNVGEQAAQLAQQMEIPGNEWAHAEYLKAVNTMVNSFLVETRLASEFGRNLNARKIAIGSKEFTVDDLKKVAGWSEDAPVEDIKFSLVDEPVDASGAKAVDDAVRATDEAPRAEVEENVPDTPDTPTEGVPGNPEVPQTAEGANNTKPPKAKAPKAPKTKKAAEPKAPKDKANVGPNTYTTVDEALQSIFDGLKKVDAELEKRAKESPEQTDLRAAKAELNSIKKSEERLVNAGLTKEDIALAKRRLRSAANIKAMGKELKEAKASKYELGPDDVADLESLTVERMKVLADAERKRPLVDPKPKKAKPQKAKEKKPPKDKAQTGPNTFGLVDEAQYRLDATDRRIAKEIERLSKMGPDASQARDDKLAYKQVGKDTERIEAAVDWLGGSSEDLKLYRERMAALARTIAKKRADAGVTEVNLKNYTEVELDDMAMARAEAIMKAAQEQRTNPLQFKVEREVKLTRSQVQAMANHLLFFPKNAKERDQAMKLLLGVAKKASPNGEVAKPSMWQRLISYRQWAMLSAPTTAEVNAVSAVSLALTHPIRGMAGAAATFNKEELKRNADLMVGTLVSIKDALKVANRAFAQGSEVLGRRSAETPMLRPIGDRSPTGVLLNVGRISDRLQVWGDELARQMSYRGHVYAQSSARLRMAGITDGEAVANAVAKDMEFAFGENGQARNPSAFQYAQDVTLRTPLDYGVGGALERLTHDLPLAKIIMPFVRIPTNIARYNMDTFPLLGFVTHRGREAQWWRKGAGAADPNVAVARQQLAAKQAFGAAVYSGAALLYASGRLTGSGPSDPSLRALDGRPPYSVFIGGKWVSYQRAEPLLTPLGLVADFMQIAGELDAEDIETNDIPLHIMAAVATNLSSKTYLKGVGDFFETVMSDEPKQFEKYLAGLAGSFVPNIATRLNPDDHARTARHMLDRVQARIPGFSNLLEPRRNIYGEKVLKEPGYFQRAFNAFTVNGDKLDLVDEELLRIGAGISLPPTSKLGVDLTDRDAFGLPNRQSPYDRWMELMGESYEGRPTLKEALRDLVRSPAYTEASEGTPEFPGGMKLRMVEKVVADYRKRAWQRLVKEEGGKNVLKKILQLGAQQRASLVDDPELQASLRGDAAVVARQYGWDF